MASAWDMDLLGGDAYSGLLDDYLANSVALAIGLQPAAAAPATAASEFLPGLLPGAAAHAALPAGMDHWALADAGDAVLHALVADKAAAVVDPAPALAGAALHLQPNGLFTVQQLSYMLERLQQPRARMVRVVSANEFSSRTSSRPASPSSPHSQAESEAPCKPPLAISAVTRVASSGSVSSMAGVKRASAVSPKVATPRVAAPAPVSPSDSVSGPSRKPKRAPQPIAIPSPTAKRARRNRRDPDFVNPDVDVDSADEAHASVNSTSASEPTEADEDDGREEDFEDDADEEDYDEEEEEASSRRKRKAAAQRRAPRVRAADTPAALIRRTVAEGPAPAASSPSALASSKHPNEKAVPLEEILPLLSCPLVEAARTLGICPTTLKKVCRKYGIQRWPSRKLRALGSKGAADERDRMVETIQTTIRVANGRRGSEAASPSPAARPVRRAARGAFAEEEDDDEDCSITDSGEEEEEDAGSRRKARKPSASVAL